MNLYSLPPYFSIPIFFVAWLLTLWLVKAIVLRHLRKWAQTTRFLSSDLVLQAISFPINLLIFISGILFLANLIPMPARIDKGSWIVFQGTVILAAVLFLDQLIQGIIQRNASKGIFGQISHGVTKGLVRGFIIGIGALLFMDLIGISITPILASLGIGSLAVALALQETLSNFFAGLYIAVDKPVETGNFVQLENGIEGYVVDIGWRTTRIRTLPNNMVFIPNAKLIGSIITNYYLPDKEVAVLVDMRVHYDSDLKRVEKVISETAAEVLKKTQGAVPEFVPFIRYHTFGESGIQFSVIMRGKEFTDNYLIKHEFIKAIHERFRKEGIVIPYPTRLIRMQSEEKKTS